MKIELTATDCDDLVIHLHGEFDAAGSNAIRPTLEDVATQSQPEHVFLDLHEVSFIDSSGVGAIVFLYKRLRENGRSLRIIGARGQARDLLEMLRIHKAIPMVFANANATTTEAMSCSA